MKKHVLNWIVFAAVVAAAIVVDQVTKLCFEGWEKSLIGNFLWISSVHNEGAAFGMMAGARWWFVGLAVPVSAAILYVVFAKKVSNSCTFVVSLALILGGILGNLIDRIFFAYVRDFVDFRFSGFAIFNMADSFLCVGCAVLVVWLLVESFGGSKRTSGTEDEGKEKTEEEK